MKQPTNPAAQPSTATSARPFFDQEGGQSFFNATPETADFFFSPVSGEVLQREEETFPTTDLELPVCAPSEWDFFAFEFNDEFRSVLHAFPSPGVPMCYPSAEAPEAQGDRPGSQSGVALTAEQLQWLFTENQRVMLSSFMRSHQIPEGLFNGDERGNVSAQQRILLSAHILAHGNYRPGSFDQRVHARMCFHWVHSVHHYAGVTPAGGLNRGVMGSFDIFGNAILGSGTNQSIFFGGRVYADELPVMEAGGIGPIPEGSGHAGAAERERQRREEDPEVRRLVHRRQAFPFERFGELRPGDWLWYYNANASGGGSHSVIFSRWASPDRIFEGIRYRLAIVFSQGSPAGGGREHDVKLGEQFHSSGSGPTRMSIYPITYVTRVSESAGPPQTVEELLPTLPEARETRLGAQNARYVAQAERRYRGRIDLERIRSYLRGENAVNIAGLLEHLSAGQQRLLTEANASEHFETLVRLTEQLRSLSTNAEILEENMERTFEGGLNERHAEALRRFEAESDRINQQIADINGQLSPIDARTRELEQRLSELDPSPEIRQLQREAGSLWRRMRELGRQHPEYEGLRVRRQEILGRKEELELERRGNRPEAAPLRTELRRLQQQRRPLERRRGVLERQLSQQERQLPYGLVHPGNLRGQSMTSPTGRLDRVFTLRQMQQFVVQDEGAGP